MMCGAQETAKFTLTQCSPDKNIHTPAAHSGPSRKVRVCIGNVDIKLTRT